MYCACFFFSFYTVIHILQIEIVPRLRSTRLTAEWRVVAIKTRGVVAIGC